jgi:flagellar motor switch protein FliN
MSDPVDYVPFETTTTPVGAEHNADAPELERLYDVPVELAVEIGRTQMTIRETLALGPGSIVTLNKLAGEPVDLLVNGKPIARGEVVVIDEEFGLRVTEVVAGETAGPEAAAPAPAEAAPGLPAFAPAVPTEA